MACNITTNTTAAINCLANRTEGGVLVGYMFVFILAIVFFLYIINNIDWPFAENISKHITQFSLMLTIWLLLPVVYIGQYLDDMFSLGLTNIMQNLYDAYFYFALILTMLYFFLFIFNVLSQYKRVLK